MAVVTITLFCTDWADVQTKLANLWFARSQGNTNQGLQNINQIKHYGVCTSKSNVGNTEDHSPGSIAFPPLSIRFGHFFPLFGSVCLRCVALGFFRVIFQEV